MDIEYNTIYTYKEMCILMNELPISTGGKDRQTQLNRWQKKYKIEKPSRGKYVIIGETSPQEVLLKHKDMYCSLIIRGLLSYLSKMENDSSTLTYYEIFEKLNMTNLKYHKAKNAILSGYGVKEEVSKFEDCISQNMALECYNKDKNILILQTLEKQFEISKELLKELVDYAIDKLKKNKVLFCYDTYKLYKVPQKGMPTVPHVATNKELATILNIEEQVLLSLGLSSKQDLAKRKNDKQLYKQYKQQVSKQIKQKLGYDGYSQAIKFVYGQDALKVEYNYYHKKELNSKVQDKLLSSKGFTNFLQSMNSEFVKQYIQI